MTNSNAPYIDVYPVGPSGMPAGTPVMDVFNIKANEPWQNPPISIHYTAPSNNSIPGNSSNVEVGDSCDC